MSRPGNRTSIAADYARAMGTSLIGLLGERPGCHFIKCEGQEHGTDQAVDTRHLLRHPWFAALSRELKDQDFLESLFVGKKALFHHSYRAHTRQDEDPTCSAGYWSVPCPNSGCNLKIDVPLPPAPDRLIHQIEFCGTNLFSEFLGREVLLQRKAAAMTQRNIYAAFCNVPHFCALVAVHKNDKTKPAHLLRTSLDWKTRRQSGQSENDAGVLGSRHEAGADFLGALMQKACDCTGTAGDSPQGVDAKSLTNYLVGMEAPFAWGQGPDERLLALRRFLLWDRVGRPGNDALSGVMDADLALDAVAANLRGCGDYDRTLYEEFDTAIDKVLRHVDDAGFSKGLLYGLPLTAVYFLTALVISDTPAFIHAVPVPIGDRSSPDTNGDYTLMAAFLLPNFAGLTSFLAASTFGNRKLPCLENYWPQGDEENAAVWQRVFDRFQELFVLPTALGSRVLAHFDPESGDAGGPGGSPCLCEDANTSWFSEHLAEGKADSKARFDAAKHLAPDDSEERQFVEKAIRYAEWSVKERLELSERQFWVSRIRNSTPEADGEHEPVFDFLGIETQVEGAAVRDCADEEGHLRAGKRASLAAAFGGEDKDFLAQYKTITHLPHQLTGIVGQLFRARIPASGISVFGDLRTMQHMAVHKPICEQLALSETADPCVRAEVYFFVKKYKDFYAFPIWVAGRLWGVLQFQRCPYGFSVPPDPNETPEVQEQKQRLAKYYADPSHVQFRNVVLGMSAAYYLGIEIQKALVRASLHALEWKLKESLDRLDPRNPVPVDSTQIAQIVKWLPCCLDVRAVERPPSEEGARTGLATLQIVVHEELKQAFSHLGLLAEVPSCGNQHIAEAAPLLDAVQRQMDNTGRILLQIRQRWESERARAMAEERASLIPKFAHAMNLRIATVAAMSVNMTERVREGIRRGLTKQDPIDPHDQLAFEYFLEDLVKPLRRVHEMSEHMGQSNNALLRFAKRQTGMRSASYFRGARSGGDMPFHHLVGNALPTILWSYFERANSPAIGAKAYRQQALDVFGDPGILYDLREEWRKEAHDLPLAYSNPDDRYLRLADWISSHLVSDGSRMGFAFFGIPDIRDKDNIVYVSSPDCYAQDNLDILALWLEEVLVNAVKYSYREPSLDSSPFIKLEWDVEEPTERLAVRLENGAVRTINQTDERIGNAFVKEVALQLLAPEERIFVGAKPAEPYVYSVSLNWGSVHGTS